MVDNDNYQRHNRLLENLHSQLDALRKYIDISRENYKSQIATSASHGFMTNYTTILETKFVRFSHLIDNLTDAIAKSKTVIVKHEQHLADLRRDSSAE